jgi:hypothetical protein
MRCTPSDKMLPFGSPRCRCPKCGLYFTTETNFDRHQRLTAGGEVVCLSDDQMRAKGLRLNAQGLWCRTYAPRRD